jgi:mRNA interferase RelE/StbE
MRAIELSRQAAKFLGNLQAKQSRQLAGKLAELKENPEPHDSSLLRGYPYRRADVGEFRIIYGFNELTVSVHLIGKRNDSEVYRLLSRSGL